MEGKTEEIKKPVQMDGLFRVETNSN